MRIDLINGPNLNLLGTREPEVYGSDTLVDLQDDMVAVGRDMGVEVVCFQSNHEGGIIDRIHAAKGAGSAGVIINPGGFTHTSVAIRDALLATSLPFVEVHISNVYAREPFRHTSMLRDAALGCIVGLGVRGYRYALDALVMALRSRG